ncbi:hypothetical protein B5M09_000564 [Aphanomyces astaci]|uniref:Uncharacterized protein n=1 Tax=Aphanomyces astaci TaxID=112090 RepID=A0A425DJS9_APHAT|nr:hypothetical protein B5M09_000564 [Aphanomyces astaci]
MRLSLDEPYAMMPPGYMKIVRSISIMASKATELVSLHLAGIRIPLEVASDLAHVCDIVTAICFTSSMDDRVSSFVNTLLQDRQMATTKQTSMNHPMEHTLLKAVLKSWGCLRRTADDDLLAKLLSKRTKTTSVASKVDHRGGKVLRRSSAPSIGGKAPLTKSSSSLRPALSSVPKASKVKSGGPKAAKKTILTKSSVKHAKHTAATTSSLKIGKQCPLTLQPERDGVTALDMLLNEQSVFRSNQEDPAVVVAAPAKRLDQQMVVALVPAENLALKQKVATVVADPKPVDASTADMIQALESAIGHLTTQVSQLETTHKTSSKRQAEDTSSFTDAMLDDLSLQLKRSFGLDE